MIKITVYSVVSNPRIEYALKIVFGVVLGVDYSCETRREQFIKHEGIKINYSTCDFNAVLKVVPCGLLEEHEVRVQDTPISIWHDLPVFFKSDADKVSFDIFSAVFFLVTRYEEYLPFESDKHGRFEAGKSLAWQGNFLRLPLVDLWCIELAKLLGIHNKCPNIQSSNYSFRLTIDIDFPWRYLHKGSYYTTGKLARDFLTFRFREFIKHIRVLMDPESDPGNSYPYLSGIENRLGHSIRYFILCRKIDTFDRNLSVGRKPFNNLLVHLDKKKNLGIHPSYASSSDISLEEEEISYLSQLLKRKIEASRQHYLLLSLPDTYRNLIQHGVRCDYTMGYASQTGFRAGIARSFNFYDLLAEKETTLRVFPFQVMDRTLLSYLCQKPEEAKMEYDYYTNVIRSVGGEFICLWHNDSLTDQGEWKGWKSVFEKMVELNEYI
jgi:hypothetical protein